MPEQRLKDSIAERLLEADDKRGSNMWLWDYVSEDGIVTQKAIDEITNLTLVTVLMAVQREAIVTEIAIMIGSRLRRMAGQPEDEKNETKIALYAGLKIMEAYCNADKPHSNFKLLTLKKVMPRQEKGRKNYPAYHLEIKDQDLFAELWATIDTTEAEETPRSSPAADWENGYHIDGLTLIRRGNDQALSKINLENTPHVINAINKLQNTGYVINHNLLPVYKKLFERQVRENVFSAEFVPVKETPFKHEKEERKPSREGMYIEAEAILKIAEDFKDTTFYHRYTTDFRGRIYPGSSYLHEQSSDNAKGLILYDHGVELGDNGAYWLAVHTANCFGEDKLPLDDRQDWTLSNIEELIGYANSPTVNTGWFDADKSWSFLACCYEWRAIAEWVNDGEPVETYKSALPIFIDGSNNGVQHLTALSLDDTVAHLVNLVPTDVPGDVYMYVAEKTWEALEKKYKTLDIEVMKNADRLIREVIDIKLKMSKAKTKTDKDRVFAELDAWRVNNKAYNKEMYIPFWMRLADDPKLQRKTVKRPVMTLGYGVTRMGVREQVFDDTKTLSEELKFKEKSWVNPFGDLLMSATLDNMKGPAAMLALFRELAERANQQNIFLEWKVPCTNFPVVQAYEASKEERIKVAFCKIGQRGTKNQQQKDGSIKTVRTAPFFRLTIRPFEKKKLEKRAQSTGAAPNIIHSFDAAHLTLIVTASDFPTTTIHDSFGCHPGNMNDLFEIVRREFVSFYESNPLEQLLTQLDSNDLMPQRGNLILEDLMESDFGFC